MSVSKSSTWLKRCQDVIPWGSSTCSKAARYLPDEPAAIVRGKGCRVWDTDEREFIDFRNGLGPVTLGYAFPQVNDAIRAQLDDGIVYGHPHPLECEVAELLTTIIPCAEKVRFLKTGGEAVAACIRLARAYTGREHILQIGYNGWLNALAVGGPTLPRVTSSSVPRGVPAGLSELHHSARWGRIDEVERCLNEYKGKVAAVVVAAGYGDMELGKSFLPKLREIADKNGTLLVFDEIVTGFRVSLAGVQEYFGVTPDLAAFAKGIANGMPLSVYCGKADIMDLLMKEVIISSTYGGETLSLAAARATIDVYRSENVVSHLWRMGELMWSELNKIFQKHSLPAIMKGFWPCAQFATLENAPQDFTERFFRAAYRNGVSLYGVNYVNFSHKDADVREALQRLDKVCVDIV